MGIELSTAGPELVNESPAQIALSGASTVKGIGLSQAFFGGSYRWSVLELSAQIGKFENPLATSPLLWDSDLRPEGAAESLDFSFSDQFQIALYGAQYSIDQVSASLTGGTPVRRSWMFQQGVLGQLSLANDTTIRLATSLTMFTNVSERLARASSQHGNSLEDPTSPNPHLKETLWPIEFFGEARAYPLGILTVLKGALLVNFQTDDQQRGFYTSASIGNSWKKNNLQGEVSYIYLEPDVTLDLLADHRFGNGNRKGPRFQMSFYVLDGLRVGSAFLYSEVLQSNLDQAARKEWTLDFEYRF